MRESSVEKVKTQPVVHVGDYVDPSTDPDGAEGAIVVIVGTPTNGQAPVYNSSTTRFEPGDAGAGAGFVPTYIGPSETFTVPADRQALYAMTIDNEGILDVVGFLIGVD